MAILFPSQLPLKILVTQRVVLSVAYTFVCALFPYVRVKVLNSEELFSQCVRPHLLSQLSLQLFVDRLRSSTMSPSTEFLLGDLEIEVAMFLFFELQTLMILGF